MFIVNHSALPDALATQIVNACISAYENLYGKPSCEVEIILCSSKRKMKQEQISIMGKDNYEDTPNHDGDFIIPVRFTNKMTITIIVEKKIIAGAKIFLGEMANGSLRDADLSDEQWEKRGLRLMSFLSFAETLLHEYSHLCSFDLLMTATNWNDPRGIMQSWDYHLHDEFIARYRSVTASLKMAEPYMELSLLYSIWIAYRDSLEREYQKEKERFSGLLDLVKRENDKFIRNYMTEYGLTSEGMTRSLEFELGHPLRHHGEYHSDGAPRLSSLEEVELVSIDETASHYIELVYYLRNRAATYQGAQLLGQVQAYYDFLSEKTGTGDPDLILPPDALLLPNVVDIPYYEYVGDKTPGLPPAMLNMDKISRQYQEIPEMFRRLAGPPDQRPKSE